FWQTATVRTIANGNHELLATINSKAYTIIEVSVRSSLQLADATGITNLPDVEIHEGLAIIGYVRILQKSQENGQNRTNTDTGKEREYKSRENAIKGQQKSNIGQPKSTI
ncbi:hypothetical protein Tco_0378724, partial [Tanacetum coccineum]